MSDTVLPLDFPGQVSYPIGDISEELSNLSKEDVSTSIRLHPHKGQHLETVYADAVSWFKLGRYLSSRPRFPEEADWHSGAYYVQDASSMVLAIALDTINLPPEPSVLDLCAAPGGKSTMIVEWLDGQGTLTANEVISSRATILSDNLAKSGYDNVIVTQQKPAQIAKSSLAYDLVLVDAPCSGEGLWRKNPQATQEWSVQNVEHCAVRQADILSTITTNVKMGGYLVYMTCTYNDHENDDQVDTLLNTGDWDIVEVHLEQFDGIVKTRFGHLLLPGRVRGEGQYMAVLQRRSSATASTNTIRPKKMTYLSRQQRDIVRSFVSEAPLAYPTIHTSKGLLYLIKKPLMEKYEALKQTGRVVRTGLLAGKLCDRLLIPSQSLAYQINRSSSISVYNCTKEQALAYVNKELTSIEAAKGWILMCHAGNGLGWAKNIGKRINNYFDK